MRDVSGAIHDGDGDGGEEEDGSAAAAAAAAAMEQELRRPTQESICSASVKERGLQEAGRERRKHAQQGQFLVVVGVL